MIFTAEGAEIKKKTHYEGHEEREGKKGTLEVDDAFLAEIEGWREILARNIALRNPHLQVRELN